MPETEPPSTWDLLLPLLLPPLLAPVVLLRTTASPNLSPPATFSPAMPTFGHGETFEETTSVYEFLDHRQSVVFKGLSVEKKRTIGTWTGARSRTFRLLFRRQIKKLSFVSLARIVRASSRIGQRSEPRPTLVEVSR